MLSPREFERIARVALGRLAANGGHLARERSAAGKARWRLYSARNRARRAIMDIPAAAAKAMIANGWLAKGQGAWTLNAAGRAWLEKRQGGVRPPRAQEPGRREMTDPDGMTRHLRVNLAESPLDWLARRKDKSGRPFLGRVQVEAGERLRADYETGRMGQKVTASWDMALAASDRRRVRSQARDGLTTNERALAARQRVHAALEAAGPGLDDILLQVCCLSRGLEAAERALDWPRRSARLILRIALQRLALHYGLEKPAPAQSRPRIAMWGLPGHSPDRALPEQDTPA